MKERIFWIDTAERAVKTFAQTLIALLTVGVPVWHVNWVESIGVALTAALLSVLTSIASTQVGDSGSAEALPETVGRHRRDND